MPYVSCVTSLNLNGRAEEEFKAGVARALAEVAGKPEEYLFVSIEAGQTLFIRGQRLPGAVIRVSLIGSLSSAQKQEITSRLCRLCQDQFGLPGDAVYVIFEPVSAGDWGWNGRLFG